MDPEIPVRADEAKCSTIHLRNLGCYSFNLGSGLGERVNPPITPGSIRDPVCYHLYHIIPQQLLLGLTIVGSAYV